MVYIIRAGESNRYKIGYTKAIKSRLAALQTGNPDRVFLIAQIEGDRTLEKALHCLFSHRRLNGEWFELDFADLEGFDLETFKNSPTPPTRRETFQSAICIVRLVSGVPVIFDQWRGYTNRNGDFIAPCPHCQHERVLKFCKAIEQAAALYPGENMIRFSQVTDQEAKTLTACLRKRRERGDGATRYTTFPLEKSSTILLHDAPDLEGQPLPVDRSELYDLVKEWVLKTPKGKRAGRGLDKWGNIILSDEN